MATKSSSKKGKATPDKGASKSSKPRVTKEVHKPKPESATMSDDQTSIIEFSEDIGDAEAPDPIPVGDYPAQIVGAERKDSAQGNAYAAVMFSISPDDFPPDFQAEGLEDGLKITYRRVPLEDNPLSRFRLKKFIEAIGAKPGKRIDLSEWIGLTATINVAHETYEGIPRAIITKVSEAD